MQTTATQKNCNATDAFSPRTRNPKLKPKLKLQAFVLVLGVPPCATTAKNFIACSGQGPLLSGRSDRCGMQHVFLLAVARTRPMAQQNPEVGVQLVHISAFPKARTHHSLPSPPPLLQAASSPLTVRFQSACSIHWAAWALCPLFLSRALAWPILGTMSSRWRAWRWRAWNLQRLPMEVLSDVHPAQATSSVLDP